jgi:hypothetical protein
MTNPSVAPLVSAAPPAASAAALVSALPPWWTELLRAGVSLMAVLLGGGITLYVAHLTFKRQAQQAERNEAERHRKEDLRERLALQRAAYAEYLRLMTKHQASTGSFGEGIGAAVNRKKREEDEAHQDALSFYGKLVLAFGSQEFAIQAADTITMIAGVRNRPHLAMLVTGPLANAVTDQMLASIGGTETALGLPPVPLLPKPLVPIADYAKERNRASLRTVVDRAGLSRERLEAIFADIDKEQSSSDDVAHPEDGKGPVTR